MKKVKFFHDWEFIDDGKTIEPISVGIVCDNGAMYYAVNRNLRWERLTSNASYAVWLRENVWPKLPRAGDQSFALDIHHQHVKPLTVIAAEVAEFCLKNSEGDEVELWGDWPAYDHVVLCQMYGRMVDKPAWIPPRTKCITQLAEDWGVDIEQAPPQPAGHEHHALLDAQYDSFLYDWIENRKRGLAILREEGVEGTPE